MSKFFGFIFTDGFLVMFQQPRKAKEVFDSI